VTFDHFRYFGTHGPDFRTLAPTLAERMYSKNVRHLMADVSEQEYCEEMKILKLAEDALPSPGRVAQHDRSCRLRQCAARGPTRRYTWPEGRDPCLRDAPIKYSHWLGSARQVRLANPRSQDSHRSRG
jgi:hypothetical protein